MSLESIRLERLKKRDQLIASGMEAYPIATGRDRTINETLTSFDGLVASRECVTLAGRIMALRGHGGAIFADLYDGSITVGSKSDSMQLFLSREAAGENLFTLWETCTDVGDFVAVSGTVFLTGRGERTLQVRNWRMLAKSVRSLPDKWHGLTDIEERFRKRYLDLLMSREVRDRFIVRTRIIQAVRIFLDTHGFLEVETPALQPLYGGASALPFVTHHNTLDTDLYLRISDELYLKRLLIGGLPKVYEIAKDFRNEGIDTTHNPEFTMVEWYESYTDATYQRAFVEQFLRTLGEQILGGTTCMWQEQEIDLAKPFAVISYADLFKKYANIADILSYSRDELLVVATKHTVDIASTDTREKLLDGIYKKVCRPCLIQPTFIVDYPEQMFPLAKRTQVGALTVDAFQLVVGGIELVKAFSELNDPIDQRARFDAQEQNRAAGETDTQMHDEDFLEALEYGCPPAGGVGVGIDRLVMLFTDTKNIKEVLLFPTMRQK